MKNCIVAQSGGPTSVINASVIGVVDKNRELKAFDNVFGGLNGIEGILGEKFINLSKMSEERLNNFRFTPSSGLGSCRYKLKDPDVNAEEYKKLFEIFKKNDIYAFFYIGGNDSMDTVAKLAKYAKENNHDVKVVGIPKTVDNDLMITDHTPGYGSAAKLIATLCLETFFDARVYPSSSVYIVEAMGRDTGWLSAAASIAKVEGEPVVDLIYIPEIAFDEEKFVNDVKKRIESKNFCFIVVSEGLKNKNGEFLGESKSTQSYDKFGHAQLGGVCNYVKNLLTQNNVAKRVKALELGSLQRCGMHIISKVDIDEAYLAGFAAFNYAVDGKSGVMPVIIRTGNEPYKSEMKMVNSDEICNKIKYFPIEWMNSEGNNVTEDAVNYITPLIQGTPELQYENGLIKFVKFR